MANVDLEGGTIVVAQFCPDLERKCYARADGESICGEYAFMVDDDVVIVEAAEWENEPVEVIEYAMVELRRYFVGSEREVDEDDE